MIYLDTNVFIAAVEQQGDPSRAARRLLDIATAGSLTAATSELTLAELLVRPFQAETARVLSADRRLRAACGDEIEAVDLELQAIQSLLSRVS